MLCSFNFTQNYFYFKVEIVFNFRIEEDIRIHPRFAYRSKRNTALERRQTQLEDCWEQFGSLGHDVASTLCNDLLFDL